MTLLEIKTYFEHYARIHPKLQHNPAVKDEQSFFMRQPADADKLIRNRDLTRCLILHPYDFDLKRSVSGENYTKPKSLAFMVLGKAKPEDPESAIAMQDECEAIGDDFIRWMIADRTTKIKGFNPNTVHSEAIGPLIDSHYGFIFLFELMVHFNPTVDLTRWA